MLFKRASIACIVTGHYSSGYAKRFSSRRHLPPINPELYNRMKAPLPSVQKFFHQTLPDMGWTTGDMEETVMDVGCGTGLVTTQWVVPLFPSLKKVVAVDLLPRMIQVAKEHNPHTKVEYEVAAIDDWSTIASWEGQMTKLISILCFHWLEDLKAAFQNVHKLLQHGGEAGLFFVMTSNFYTVVLKIARDPKWRRFFRDVDNHYVPLSQLKDYGILHYKDIVQGVGLTVKHMARTQAEDSFSAEEFRNFFTSICVLVAYVPDELKEEFQHDLIERCLLENDVHDRERPVNHSAMIELILKKN